MRIVQSVAFQPEPETYSRLKSVNSLKMKEREVGVIKNLFIPKLGMTMEKGTISEWVVKDGEQVREEQVVLILETEKVAHEIVAPIAGFLAVFGKTGEEYLCGIVIGAIAETKEEYERIKKDPQKFVAEQASSTAADGQEKPSEDLNTETEVAAPVPRTEPHHLEASERIRISPVARHLAGKHGIDISSIKGTGPGSRIIKRDIETAMASQRQEPVVAPTAAVQMTSAAQDADRILLESIPFTGMRKSIGENLHNSLISTARVTVMFELNVTDLIEFRNHYARKADILGYKVTYTDLFVLMVTKCLKAVPIMNASLIGNEIKIWRNCNIGFAVAVKKSETESGLLVPVIKNAEQMSLGDIAKARIVLMEKARNNSLSMNELSGGTFTLTNTGALSSAGWQIQTPIINPGEAAILGTSAIVERPVVKNGEIVIGSIMPMSLSFDHRIMDGTPPGQFIDKLAQMATDPQMILL